MSLSTAHTSAKAADPAKVLLLKTIERRGKTYLVSRSVARPHLTITVTVTLPDPILTQRDPDYQYHKNLVVSFVAHVPHFHRIQ